MKRIGKYLAIAAGFTLLLAVVAPRVIAQVKIVGITLTAGDNTQRLKDAGCLKQGTVHYKPAERISGFLIPQKLTLTDAVIRQNEDGEKKDPIYLVDGNLELVVKGINHLSTSYRKQNVINATAGILELAGYGELYLTKSSVGNALTINHLLLSKKGAPTYIRISAITTPIEGYRNKIINLRGSAQTCIELRKSSNEGALLYDIASFKKTISIRFTLIKS